MTDRLLNGVLILSILLSVLVIGLLIYDNIPKGFSSLSEGVFEKVEYTNRDSIIYFSDGRACILRDRRQGINFPRGTKIEVLYDSGLKKYSVRQASE